MKKLFLILVLGLFAFVSFGQTATADKYVNSAKHFSGWGTAGDTVTNAATVNYVVRVKTADLMKLHVGIKTDSVSGTPSYTCTLGGSMDGVNYTTVQAITTTTGVDTFFNYTAVDATYNYYRLSLVGAAAAQNATLSNYWTFRKKND
jgi:hypothetical protein